MKKELGHTRAETRARNVLRRYRQIGKKCQEKNIALGKAIDGDKGRFIKWKRERPI